MKPKKKKKITPKKIKDANNHIPSKPRKCRYCGHTVDIRCHTKKESETYGNVRIDFNNISNIKKVRNGNNV